MYFLFFYIITGHDDDMKSSQGENFHSFFIITIYRLLGPTDLDYCALSTVCRIVVDEFRHASESRFSMNPSKQVKNGSKMPSFSQQRPTASIYRHSRFDSSPNSLKEIISPLCRSSDLAVKLKFKMHIELSSSLIIDRASDVY